MSLNAQHSSKDDTQSIKKSIDETTTTRLHTSDSTNVFNMSRNQQRTCENTPSSYEHSRSQTAEKIIEIELTNETLRKPHDQDDCSCTKKYLPYKVNERNVWQVYETSDCKYIQSKVEIDEIFQPPPDTGDSTMTSEHNPHMLHSRSNFSNEIICHAINHESNHRENATTSTSVVNTQADSCSLYTPTFNIKPLNLDVSSSCHCNEDEDEIKVDNKKSEEVVPVVKEVNLSNF